MRKFIDMGYHNVQFNFRLDSTRIGEILQGQTPSRNSRSLSVTSSPRRITSTTDAWNPQ